MTGSSAIGDGTTITVEFPYVSSAVTVTAKTASVRVHFANTGNAIAGLHFVTLEANERMTFNVKCKEVFVTGTAADSAFDLSAELTNIEPSQMYALTGAGLDTA